MTSTTNHQQSLFAAALRQLNDDGYKVEFHPNDDPEIEGAHRVQISRWNPMAWGHGASPQGALADACDSYQVRGPEGCALEDFLGSIDPKAELDAQAAECPDCETNGHNCTAHGGRPGVRPAYPAPGSDIPDQPGFVVATCGHRVARSEWRAGFRVCERCPSDDWADDQDAAS